MQLLPTAYVVRREGNVFTRVCPSIHPSVCPHWLGGGVPQPGPDGRGVPQPGPDGGPLPRGYPTLGTPHWTWPGVPWWGVSHLRYPPSDLVRGYPNWGYPTLGTPPIESGWGLDLPPPSQTWLGVPHLGYPPLHLARGDTLTRGGTPPRITPPPPSDLAGGYPDGGYPTSYRITDGVLDTPRSVWLLRSRRRTFLLKYSLTIKIFLSLLQKNQYTQVMKFCLCIPHIVSSFISFGGKTMNFAGTNARKNENVDILKGITIYWTVIRKADQFPSFVFLSDFLYTVLLGFRRILWSSISFSSWKSGDIIKGTVDY